MMFIRNVLAITMTPKAIKPRVATYIIECFDT
ncbi:hypothetical protein NTE_03529 [Candidatus Nitrososphaera evergladensis SR1]|uniref:Uncharacterized protein n=1 Tax=Candidatus Nitrososphaera evergladensis SR1 TaxID=1459636 RepID=A0A075MY23_9ARCH|nr:hypothetical protein NTE_03529 [Candidatus Nitrososphaera evergladensis SR1]